MIYTIDKIAEVIHGQRVGTAFTHVAFLLTDSRSLGFPEETLFFALKTERNDGHRYIPELYQRGVRSFVVEEAPSDWAESYPEANFLVVDSSFRALQTLARWHRECISVPVVGITGSNGKTVVKEWLFQLLSPQMNITRSPRSYNSQVGVPLSLWLLNEQTQLGVIEAGISQPGEMEALQQMIQPTVGVLTSIGGAHQENFSSLEEKCREKLRLFASSRAIIYCADDELAARLIRETYADRQLVAWSMKSAACPLYINKVEKRASETMIEFVYQGVAGSYTLPLIDDASVQNSIHCLAVALYLQVNVDEICAQMARLEPVAMRLEVKEGQHGCTLINDSYNSDIHSLDIALDFMNRRPDHDGRKRTLILSDIQQTGMDDATLYCKVSDLISTRGVQKFIGIGPHIKAQSALFGVAERFFFDSCEELIRAPEFAQLRNEVILLKGARSFGFDQLTELLVKKVHETILEVNLSALVSNLNYYRSFLHPTTKLVCMIKADGYGAGAVEVAKTLQDHRVDYLAVAVADEGVALRNNGITANIMVMNPEMSSFKTLFDYRLEPEVYSFRLLDALVRAARHHGVAGFPVHVKLDTGMHRLGFHPVADMDELISRLQGQRALIPRSVFSHFAGADSDELDAFSDEQFALFVQGSERLQAAFSHKILRHICNSAGIEHFPERQMDMCRLGLGLYGVSPRDNRVLANVCTLKTTILQMREVPATETVGYGRRGVLGRDSVIAAVPIGYADGLSRKLGNGRSFALVNGKEAPYVGNICMDVAMLDVTGIDCEEGDSVEIFGDHLPVTRLSDVMDTIPYEVLTGISNRVKRVYFQD